MEQITSDDGVKNIIETLNYFYSGNEIQKAFDAIDDLMHFQCTPGLSIEQFIMMFQLKVNKVKSTDTVLSDGLLGYVLLKAANLSDFNNNLVKATCNQLTYENVKTQLQKIGLRKVNVDQVVFDISSHDLNIIKKFNSGQNKHCDLPGQKFNMNRGEHIRRDKSRHSHGFLNRHKFFNCPHASTEFRNKETSSSSFTFIGVEDVADVAFDKAVLHTGCTRTVAGNVWFQSYFDSLSRNDKSSIRLRTSKRKYTFEDGVVYSCHCAVIPVYVGNLRFTINVDIINCNVPLILARDALQQLSARIQRGSSTITVHGITLPLTISRSGHMCLQVGRPLDLTHEETKKVLYRILSSSENGGGVNVKDQARKLHLQFCHRPANHLIDFLKHVDASN